MKTLKRWAKRTVGLFGGSREEQRLREEFAEHIAHLTDDNLRAGMSQEEARRQAILAFGPVESLKEAYRDQRSIPGLDALFSDAVFGWRQLKKHGVTSATAILSLALAIGASTAAFRLVDAVLLRRLPVAEPDRLFFVATTAIDADGKVNTHDELDYPTFRQYRDAIEDRADAMVVGMSARQDVTYTGNDQPEKLRRQFLSGNVFSTFGLRPTLGRLLSPQDDLAPGAHAVAVITDEYWARRFGRDPSVVGRRFRMADHQYEIVGVAPRGFIGTEPGELVDAFVPAMMNVEAIENAHWSWFRMWVRPKPGVPLEEVRQPLQALFNEEHRSRLKNFPKDTPKPVIERFLSEKVLMLPAATGASRLQKDYVRPLWVLSCLVILVLLVACANVANLLTAQAVLRAKEMALRISIGAGRWRLIQLMLVESAMLAVAASALGMVLAAWAAPLVTSMLRVPGDPVQLVLRNGWREAAFSLALALIVTLVFGLIPALRASGVQPGHALKRPPAARLTNQLLAAQVAFCVLVLLIAGLFIGTFRRLANRPLGFSPDRVLILDTSAESGEQPAAVWTAVGAHLRGIAGVQSVALARWPLLSGNRWTGEVRVAGRAVQQQNPFLLDVSPQFFETMRIGVVAGRDFRPEDVPPGNDAPGVGIVNEAFIRTYFDGRDALGRSVDLLRKKPERMTIVGVVRDVAYTNLRDKTRPTIFLPFTAREHSTFLVRTAADPQAFASALRREVSRARSDFRVRTIETQDDFIRWHLVRERLLATLSFFFAIVALTLAAVGLYGVLSDSVNRQRREIGIRMAFGARAVQVVRTVTGSSLAMAGVGALVGLAGGLVSAHFVETLLYGVKATDAEMLLAPIAALAGVALVAAIPPAFSAARIDPALTLRNE